MTIRRTTVICKSKEMLFAYCSGIRSVNNTQIEIIQPPTTSPNSEGDFSLIYEDQNPLDHFPFGCEELQRLNIVGVRCLVSRTACVFKVY